MVREIHSLRHYFLHWLKASRGGHGIHSPFAYSLCEEVFYNKAQSYSFEKFDGLRKQLLADGTTMQIQDLGAGSRSLKGNTRSIREIATKGISDRQQSELLFHLARFLNVQTIVELGTSVGLNTLYLASANPKAKVHTIEGSPSLSTYARNLAAGAGIQNINFHEGNFDQLLEPLLKQLGSFDLLYIDGNHRYEPTLRYFQSALQHSHAGSVIVLDDIYWSAEMTKAWNEIKSDKRVRLSIDLYQMGLLFFSSEIREPLALRMWI